MKTSELMIGDIISLGCRELIRKVVGLDGKIDIVTVKAFDSCNLRIHYSAEDVTPIPLTEEILKAIAKVTTGLCSGKNQYVFSEGIHSLKIFCDKLGFYFYFNDRIISITFVHELQHALRLCGLTALAENFGKEDYAWLQGESK